MLGQKIEFDTNQDRDTHYAERWAEFAAAALTGLLAAGGTPPRDAPEVADDMLKEYQARFGWITPGGSGPKEET